MEGLKEFKKRIKKVSSPRIHKITNSLGVYDAFKYYRKNKPKDKKYVLTESQYFNIIRQVNNILSQYIINGKSIIFPEKMGTIELRKKERTLKLDDEGNIITNMPVDWDRTLELWYEDKESRENKTLVRMESNELFKIYYNKSKANFNNKSFYDFRCIKDIKLDLKRNIKRGRIDAPLLFNNNNIW